MLKDFTGQEFDIIIQAGQSNSEGYGLGDTDIPFVPDEKILYLNSDFSISIAREHELANIVVGNFALSFAHEYINSGKLDEGRKLLILRTAVGGTGFSDNRWGICDDLFIKMTEMIKTSISLNPKNRLVALLWHQGETDAGFGVSHDTHYQNLLTFVNTVRNIFECDALPFIAGDFVYEWKTLNLKICEPVVSAIKDVCTDIVSARFVETSELQSNNQRIGNGDIIHFCRHALNELGRKYFKAFCEISQ